jgi:polyhydroxyalkanoate synthesis repressor PhaR
MIKEMAVPRIVIKKYENRRLYDTTNSRYVNLEDIAQLVRQGADVQVVDAASGDDLTRIVLTQIIVENAKEPDSGFPLDLLRQMIMASGKASKDSFLKYMQTMADMYQNVYRAFTPGFGPFTLFPQGQPPAPGAAPEPEPARNSSASPSSAAASPSVDELHRRIEELERAIASSRSAPKSRRVKNGAAGKSKKRL